jgi:hypothetical protein
VYSYATPKLTERAICKKADCLFKFIKVSHLLFECAFLKIGNYSIINFLVTCEN